MPLHTAAAFVPGGLGQRTRGPARRRKPHVPMRPRRAHGVAVYDGHRSSYRADKAGWVRCTFPTRLRSTQHQSRPPLMHGRFVRPSAIALTLAVSAVFGFSPSVDQTGGDMGRPSCEQLLVALTVARCPGGIGSSKVFGGKRCFIRRDHHRFEASQRPRSWGCSSTASCPPAGATSCESSPSRSTLAPHEQKPPRQSPSSGHRCLLAGRAPLRVACVASRVLGSNRPRSPHSLASA